MDFKICRVCLDRSASISVFSKQGDIPYCVKIMRCVKVMIEEGDGFPDAICDGCAADLAVSYEFAQRCEASDKALRCLGLLQTASYPDTKDDNKHEPEIKLELLPVQQQKVANFTEGYIDREFYDEPCPLEIDNVDTEIHNTKSDLNIYNYDEISNNKKFKITGSMNKCAVCGWRAACGEDLEQHTCSSSNEKPYTCDLCHKSYSSKCYLKLHVQRHFNVKKNKWKDTKKTQNKKDPLQCTTCGVMRVNQRSLQSHMRTHTGEKPFACEVCGATFRYKEILNRHVNSRHRPKPERVFQCDHCGKVFYGRSTITVHMRIHSGVQPYQCQYCHKKFNQIGSMIRHVRSHTGSRPYACATCGKAFNDKTLLNRHQVVHTSEKKFSCDVCNKRYKTKGALKTHTDHHNNVKLFVCSVCGLTFTFKGNLKVHMRRKHSEKSGTCTVCNKEYGDIEAHMCVHTGRKPFTCKICGQSYVSPRGLTHHIHQKHKEPHKYRCGEERCGAAFPLPHMLRHHRTKLHSADAAPHVCPHCARAFTRTSDLSRHLNLNHLDTQAKVIKRETQLI